ncbi:Terminase small subunit [Sphingobium yanoikuyae]|uniref:Terminase small subunit n=1 Tax=Sphingobium yanoikuyae TaxID=13690 RepID=A0A084EGT9_SPHYA|nr:terminase small subunit [Sphingobium yanoikuyae]KEZ17181.1 Terminase small subunit [Sphingobium yanoikuyae]
MTPKQQRFVDEYLIDLNATQAAIRAGYSAKTANEQGARLLANVSVRNAVSEAKAKRSKETGIDAAWVLSRLAAEAFADLADLYDENGRVKPVKDWPLVWRQGLVAGIEVETIGEGAGHVTKVKISDRIKRVELIGKHVDVQAFKEKLEVAAAMTLVIDPKDAAL